MQPVLIHPAYFGSIAQFSAMVKNDRIIFENEDNYQKQTYRNRMYIYDANGPLLLNIPIKHSSALGITKKGKQKYKEIQIENDFEWQKNHWRALKASYQTSPFFEFFEDELYPLYHKKFKFLMDFNYEGLAFVTNCLQIELDIQKTSEYFLEPKAVKNYRSLIKPKAEPKYNFEAYPQVFQNKHGFISNLSVLDLIFNEGNAALDYLKRQDLKAEMG